MKRKQYLFLAFLLIKTLSIKAQEISYKPKLLEVKKIYEYPEKEKLQSFRLLSEVIDFIEYEFRETNNKYFFNNLMIFGGFNLCDFNCFLSSPNLEQYSTRSYYRYTGYLNILTSEPYSIKVAFRNDQTSHTIVSYIYDYILCIVDIPNDYIDDVIIEDEVQTSNITSFSFVCLDFQSDGTYEILKEKEGFIFLKKYNIMGIND